MSRNAAAGSVAVNALLAPTFADYVSQSADTASSVSGRSRPHRRGNAKIARGSPDASFPWWQKPFHRVKSTADLLGCSSTKVYQLAGEGRLVMKRLSGRVVIETASIVALAQSAEPWTPSTRGEAGRRKRAELAAQKWR